MWQVQEIRWYLVTTKSPHIFTLALNFINLQINIYRKFLGWQFSAHTALSKSTVSEISILADLGCDVTVYIIYTCDIFHYWLTLIWAFGLALYSRQQQWQASVRVKDTVVYMVTQYYPIMFLFIATIHIKDIEGWLQ